MFFFAEEDRPPNLFDICFYCLGQPRDALPAPKLLVGLKMTELLSCSNDEL